MKRQGQGRVVVGYGAESIIELEDGTLLRCKTRRRTGRAVCGDHVHFRQSTPQEGVIEQILPRRNQLSRTNYRGQERVLAANIDLLAPVIAPEPEPDFMLVDRYLVLAEHIGAQAAVVCNKADFTVTGYPDLRERMDLYRMLDYPTIETSAATGSGVEALAAVIGTGTGILVGQSGVGKSSLINRLVPDRHARTQALSHASGQGRHTTTETTLYRLPTGGSLIDSPGIRILRLAHLSTDELAHGFRELRPWLGQCQFRDCVHREEPECAVRAAVKRGDIAPYRLAAFHRLLDETRGG
ncbi:MAG: ribosome small subunit-dependent GTPase A [Ectothiorhodospiraceae bacterium]|nr:ribosome small subunit-dependent GTPase A [Ectothiorhodospiraceae bacterium]